MKNLDKALIKEYISEVTTHPRNIALLFEGYIVNFTSTMVIRNGITAKEIRDEYIKSDYEMIESLKGNKRIDKNIRENINIEDFKDFEKEAIERLTRYKLKENGYLDSIEFIFDIYENKEKIEEYPNQEIEEIKIDDKFTYFKYGEDKYYKVFSNDIKLIKKSVIGATITFISKEYKNNYEYVLPIAIKDYHTGYILGMVMPLNEKVTKEYFDNLD